MEKKVTRNINTLDTLEQSLLEFYKSNKKDINSHEAMLKVGAIIGGSKQKKHFYIALDGSNTAGKSVIGSILTNKLSQNGTKAILVKTISEDNIFGRLFYGRDWSINYYTDPFLIAASTNLQLRETLLSYNDNLIIILDRYQASAEVFLESCLKRETNDEASTVDIWFRSFSLPKPDIQVLLINSSESYKERYKERYEKNPTEVKVAFHNRTVQKFQTIALNSLALLLDTSSTTTEQTTELIIRKINSIKKL